MIDDRCTLYTLHVLSGGVAWCGVVRLHVSLFVKILPCFPELWKAEPEASDRGQSGEYSDLDRHDEESPMSLKSSDNVDRVKRDLSSTCRGTTASEGGQAGFEDAVNELDDIVTGMNTFIEDSRAGVDGAEVEPVGGDVRFDVDKFMSLLNGEDLM